MSDIVTEPVMHPEPPSIGELIRRLIEEIGDLFRAEIRLARSEAAATVSSAKTGAIAVAAGAGLLSASMLAFLLAAIGWLTPRFGPGLAAFIVGSVVALLGGVCIAVGVSKIKAVRLSPERTVARLKRDAEALKGEA